MKRLNQETIQRPFFIIWLLHFAFLMGKQKNLTY